MPSSFQFLIQLVQHHISAQRTQWPALRHALRRRLESAVLHDPGVQVFVYQRDYPPVLHRPRQHLNQFAVVHCVKVGL